MYLQGAINIAYCSLVWAVLFQSSALNHLLAWEQISDFDSAIIIHSYEHLSKSCYDLIPLKHTSEISLESLGCFGSPSNPIFFEGYMTSSQIPHIHHKLFYWAWFWVGHNQFYHKLNSSIMENNYTELGKRIWKILIFCHNFGWSIKIFSIWINTIF